ncbi:MAG: hypothetical protein H6551_08380 [Chitinophagales bacterium]|nr:hypothetical protein [Chitinophagaceae bacterium]MCB9065139.1 hypothetical protein [Chitinophagales bacterium]
MTRRIHLLTALIVMTLYIVGCNYDKKEKAAALDARIGGINDTLLLHGKAWGDELKISVNTLDFTQLGTVRTKMQGYIDARIDEVGQLEHVGGSEELVQTELEFLETERNIVENRFSAFEQFDDSVTMDELTEAYAQIQISAEKEQALLKKLQSLREQYADKNGFPKYIDKY